MVNLNGHHQKVDLLCFYYDCLTSSPKMSNNILKVDLIFFNSGQPTPKIRLENTYRARNYNENLLFLQESLSEIYFSEHRNTFPNQFLTLKILSLS